MGNQNPGIHIPSSGACDPQVRQALQDIVRHLGISSIPVFDSVTLKGSTASRLISVDADQTLESSDLANWVDGTDNQITRTDDEDGTVTLSTPQDLDEHTDWKVGTLTVWNASESITMYVNDDEFYVTLSAEVPIATGMPMGLLLTLTYNLD